MPLLDKHNESLAQPSLRRRLGLVALIIYGIVLIQPTAPMPVFGVIYTQAAGHVVTAILIAMVAMLFTAFSYGRMARAYPGGGSAFTYVGKELHPALGYLSGWCLVLDYVLNPLICTIWCSKAAVNFLPGLPYPCWVVIFAVAFTLLNLNGVETSARINAGIALVLTAVIVLIVTAAIRFLHAGRSLSPGMLLLPFYNPNSFSASKIFHGTSIAVLTYIGFDGISTLADETKDPQRTLPRAIVITCAVTGILAAIEAYLAQLCWPIGAAFPDIDTAYVHIAGRIGGPSLFAITNAALLIATIGSGMAAQLGAARILFSMGQQEALPKRFFGAVSSQRAIPANNVLLVGAICVVGGLCLSYEIGAELLNFGALLAFVGVNLSAARHAFLARPRSNAACLASVAGAMICAFLWSRLSLLAIVAGSIWATVGIALWLARRGHPVHPSESPQVEQSARSSVSLIDR